ncbi:MAG: type II and III secretion system protein family protein [Proteobacteria bacterium]|nr:type II and III secretion system protein family protein [Pseudomonadota bacterium]
MRNFSLKSCGAVLAGIAGLVAPLLLLEPATAQDAGARRAARPVSNVIPFHNEHQSSLRLTERDGFPVRRAIKLGKSKSMLIEISRELRDVVVSDPAKMDAVVQSSNRVFLIGKAQGQSNIFLFDTNGEQIVTLEVEVERDTSTLDALYKRLLPGSNIKTEMLNETVILTGSVRNPVDATRAADIASRFALSAGAEGDTRAMKKVINLLAVEAEEQVMLRVQVAEVERSVLKQLGINLGAQITAGNLSLNMLTDNALPLTSAQGLGTLPVAGIGTQALAAGGAVSCATAGVLCNYNNGPQSTFGNAGVSSGFQAGNQKFIQALRMLERNGLVKTLAEPNLTAISGEAAKFLAGGEYPVPTVDTTGKLSVTYKEYGVAVAFTPVVLSEGRISLKIETEVSELTSNGAVTLSSIQIPALKKRQAKSTVELPSGGTIAMAGLISEDTRKNIDGTPGLKDLPILGTLFRSQDFIKNETELVVLVTPIVVRPQAAAQLARPTDGLAPASDLKSNFLGHLNRVYGREAPVAVHGGLKDGSVGFIVD